jgi:hypothetical protein
MADDIFPLGFHLRGRGGRRLTHVVLMALLMALA